MKIILRHNKINHYNEINKIGFPRKFYDDEMRRICHVEIFSEIIKNLTTSAL